MTELRNPCPSCDSMTHDPEIAKQIYPGWRDWGATALLEDADRVCPWCYAVRIDGEWDRLKRKRDRARHLANQSSNADKDIGYYMAELGELPESDDSGGETEAAW